MPVQLLGLQFLGHKKLFYGAAAEGKPAVPPPMDPWVLLCLEQLALPGFIRIKTGGHPVLQRLQACGLGKQESGSKPDAAAVPRAVWRERCSE